MSYIMVDIETDGWNGYALLKESFTKLKQIKPKGEKINHIRRVIMGFKGRLRGIHLHIDYLQSYIDKYTYRFNKSFMKDGLREKINLYITHTCYT